MNRTKQTITSMVVSFLLALGLVAVPSAAFADGADSTVSTAEIAAALNSTNVDSGNLIAEPVASTTDVNSAAVATSDGTTVDVPKDPSDGVHVTANGQEVSISVPNADDASNATRLSDGTVAYAGNNGSANAVVPTGDGVQMLTTIANADAPTRYAYKVSVPNGGRVKIAEAGQATITDGSGKVIAVVAAPWATDADGTSVPTHYETNGTTLTQVVDHTDGHYAYPVTADPNLSWHWWGVEAKYNHSETQRIGWATGAAIAYMGWTGYGALVGYAAHDAAVWATNHGYCLDVKMYYYRWPYPSFVYYHC